MAGAHQRILGFVSTKGKLVCRDTGCLELLRLRGDQIENVVRRVAWHNRHCAFCREPLD